MVVSGSLYLMENVSAVASSVDIPMDYGGPLKSHNYTVQSLKHDVAAFV